MFEGNREHDFRTATARNAAKMNGVVRCTFVCRVCHKTHAIAGRKAMVPGYSKAGYKCATCAAKRSRP